MPPVYFLGDRLTGLEATIKRQTDGTTAIEVFTVGTVSATLAEPTIEQLLLVMLLELRRLSVGMSLTVGKDLTEYSDL